MIKEMKYNQDNSSLTILGRRKHWHGLFVIIWNLTKQDDIFNKDSQ